MNNWFASLFWCFLIWTLILPSLVICLFANKSELFIFRLKGKSPRKNSAVPHYLAFSLPIFRWQKRPQGARYISYLKAPTERKWHSKTLFNLLLRLLSSLMTSTVSLPSHLRFKAYWSNTALSQLTYQYWLSKHFPELNIENFLKGSLKDTSMLARKASSSSVIQSLLIFSTSSSRIYHNKEQEYLMKMQVRKTVIQEFETQEDPP